MLQGIPTVKEAKAFKKILNDFAMATGIEVSLDKPKLFFFNTNNYSEKSYYNSRDPKGSTTL